ncbi:MAG: hypothetical protein Q9225_001055 [Loekoesia sp. 1 TL-2023]
MDSSIPDFSYSDLLAPIDNVSPSRTTTLNTTRLTLVSKQLENDNGFPWLRAPDAIVFDQPGIAHDTQRPETDVSDTQTIDPMLLAQQTPFQAQVPPTTGPLLPGATLNGPQFDQTTAPLMPAPQMPSPVDSQDSGYLSLTTGPFVPEATFNHPQSDPATAPLIPAPQLPFPVDSQDNGLSSPANGFFSDAALALLKDFESPAAPIVNRGPYYHPPPATPMVDPFAIQPPAIPVVTPYYHQPLQQPTGSTPFIPQPTLAPTPFIPTAPTTTTTVTTPIIPPKKRRGRPPKSSTAAAASSSSSTTGLQFDITTVDTAHEFYKAQGLQTGPYKMLRPHGKKGARGHERVVVGEEEGDRQKNGNWRWKKME